jgi:NAD(P)-dependent dehydrogenase (short-subunit alcohol dehydrogenase family)
MTVILGRQSSFLDAIAARLGASDGDDGRVVAVWDLDASALADPNGLRQLEIEIQHALSWLQQALRALAVPVSRVVLIARENGAIGRVLASFAVGFAKSLAREMARSGATVNCLVARTDEAAAVEFVSDTCRFLMSEDAGFVTGQVLADAAPSEEEQTWSRINPGQPPKVLISGGAGSIGEAITRRLHCAGWSTVIGSTDLARAENLVRDLDPSGLTCTAIALDLMDRQSVRAAPFRAGADTSGLDALVLCAGWNRTAPFLTTEDWEWERTTRVNLIAPCQLTSALLPSLRLRHGVVVGIGSESAKIGDRGRSVYAGAKAGLAAYLMALGCTGTGIRAATVAPGPIDTPLLHNTHGDEETAEVQMERLRSLVPLRRFGRPDEIAAAVSFLLSRAGEQVPGVHLSVGGGITMQ